MESRRGFFDLHFVAIEIDSSLNYKYYGADTTMRQGIFSGKVSQQFWDSLNILFEKIDFKCNGGHINPNRIAVKMVVDFKGEKDSISNNQTWMPDKLTPIYHYLINSSKNIDLQPSTDSSLYRRAKGLNGETVFTPPKVVHSSVDFKVYHTTFKTDTISRNDSLYLVHHFTVAGQDIKIKVNFKNDHDSGFSFYDGVGFESLNIYLNNHRLKCHYRKYQPDLHRYLMDGDSIWFVNDGIESYYVIAGRPGGCMGHYCCEISLLFISATPGNNSCFEMNTDFCNYEELLAEMRKHLNKTRDLCIPHTYNWQDDHYIKKLKWVHVPGE